MGNTPSAPSPDSASARALAIPELALSILTHSDTASLLHTSLVNRHLSRLSQLLLFGHPRLDQPHQHQPHGTLGSQLGKLLGVLQARADLCRVVRSLAFSSQVQIEARRRGWVTGSLVNLAVNPAWRELRLPNLVEVGLRSACAAAQVLPCAHAQWLMRRISHTIRSGLQ